MENPMRPQLAFAVKRKQQPGITRKQLTREERVLIDAAASRLGTAYYAARIISQAVMRQGSASSRRKSEVKQVYTVSPEGI